MIIKRNKTYTREQIVCLIEWAFPEIDQKNRVYVGLTNDPQTRLTAHKVDNEDAFIVVKAIDRTTAMEVEKYLLNFHPDALGDTGGGKDDTVYVYAFEWVANKHQK